MLSATLRQAARRFGERTAFVAPAGWSLSYDGLDRLADEVAAALSSRGVGVGDVVAVVLPPCPEYVALQVATARIGAAIAGVNHRLSAPERAAVLAVADPVLVLDAELVVPAERADDALDGLRVRGATVADAAPDPERPVAIVFTSGTTGTPRGAVFAARQVDFITEVDTGGHWGDPALPPAHSLSGLSLTHLGPTTKLEGNLRRGGTTHLLERWSPVEALELVDRYRMPVLAGVPTQIALMVDHPDRGRFDLSCVQAVVMGGGPATPSMVRRVRERLGVPVMVRYSCTEAGIGLGTAHDDPPEAAEETVGRPHAGVELSLRDQGGEAVPAGEVGEVCLRSAAVMSGYHRDPGATVAAFWDGGWVRTGDLGRLDDAGRLRLMGRSKEMFVRGGNNVHPLEVEAALASHPAIAAVAVVPRPDDVMGEVGVAVVVPADPAGPPTLAELRDHGAASLAPYKLPEELVVLDEMPLTPMDKLDRRALAAHVADPPDTGSAPA